MFVRGFDYTGAMRRLCDDICTRVPELQHIEIDRVAIGFAQARKRSTYGVYATLTPLRFPGGQRFERRSSRMYTIQKVVDDQGSEMLYILTFYLPRFHDLDFEQKLITIFHELWHISPQCDGDIRRFEGRCYAHSPSQKHFDDQAHHMSRKWLASSPPDSLFDFLRLRFDQLVAHFGGVYGNRFGQPKILPVPARDGRRRPSE
jgi:hypothetical protein